MTNKQLQTFLNTVNAYVIDVDGIIGPNTRRAILAAQTKLGLVVDGIVGPQTRQALRRYAEDADSMSGRAEPDKSAMRRKSVLPSTDDVNQSGTIPYKHPKLLSTARVIDELDIHCAATPEGKDFTVNDIRRWHKQRGFHDIGYHFVCYRNGSILAGRPIGQIGAHIRGQNLGSIGFCYIGGVTADMRIAKDTRTLAQRQSMLQFAYKLLEAYPGIKCIRGHNEYAAKACPSFDVPDDPLGNLADFRRGIRR